MKRVWMLPKIEYLPFEAIEETRDVALVTSAPAWEAVKDKLSLNVVWRYDAQVADEDTWAAQTPSLQGEVVYAVGGGMAVDVAKYMAAQRQLPLVCLPTVLSVDAFLTWASGVRREGCVYYIETKPPDQLIIDFDVLAAAPKPVRAAGICDVLSIATGLWDWRYAHECNNNPANMAYIPYVDEIAQGILNGSLDCAEAAGQGDPQGLKQLLDCLGMEVQLCNQIGHSRPEEGSEHYFAYSVENVMGKGLPHGDLVGPGIVLIAGLQGQDVEPLKRALMDCQIPLTNIPQTAIVETLRTLPDYSFKHNLPYGIAHELDESVLKHLASLT